MRSKHEPPPVVPSKARVRGPAPDCPQASADERFGWIERGIRRAFKAKKPSAAAVAEVEEQIVAHFTRDCSCVLVLAEADQCRRLLIHAVAQYHGLSSQSVELTTLVQLPRGATTYTAPMTPLSARFAVPRSGSV